MTPEIWTILGTGFTLRRSLAGPKVRPHPAPSGVGEFYRIR